MSETAAGVVPVVERRVISVNQVVTAAVAIGTAAVMLTFSFGDRHAGAFEVPWLEGPLLSLVLVVGTCIAELVAVRLRHAEDAVEELTLLDGVVLLNTLLLPIRAAIVVTLTGILIAYVLRRRGAMKAMYNLGVYAAASSLTAFLVHAVMSAEGAFDLRLVFAMTAGATAFVAVNLGFMAVLLNAISAARPWDVVREDASLSVLTIIGTVGVTGAALAMSVATPVLLPCSVLPAVALRYAYGASAAKYDERRRSSRVLEYSRVLASGPNRDEALVAFLTMVRQEFEAPAAVVAFEDGSGLRLDDSSPHPYSVPAADYRPFLDNPGLRIAETAELPLGWRSAMTAPVVVDGRPAGVAIVASSVSARLETRHLAELGSLTSSLAVAVQNADQTLRLIEETSKLRAVVDQASDGIIVLADDGAIEVWSPAMTVLTAVTSPQAIGARVSDVIVLEDDEGCGLDPFEEGKRRLSPDVPHCTVDVDIVRADGERRATRFSHAGVFEGRRLVQDVIIVHDLTAERQVQRMKSDFIATVSHELRTPLTPIKGYATMLRERGATMPPQKRERALDVIVDRADHLARLVEDLLTTSTITTNQEPTLSLATGEADLAALVAGACDDFPNAASRIRIHRPSAPVPVRCDATRVVQIMNNLVSNALKYSSEHSSVDVVIENTGSCGHVVVTDCGLGIPADQLERIFDKFHRVEDPMAMSTSGTGLGLFIARRLARAMGGDVVAASVLGVGSTFGLSLPLAAAGQAHEAQAVT